MTKHIAHLSAAAVLAGLLLTWALPAQAQDDASQHTEELSDAAPDDDKTSLVVTAGGVLQTGNTESLQFNAGSRFELVRGIHSFQAELAYVLGLGSGFDFDNPTAHNFNARARYDLFFTPDDAAFLSAALREDRFAALAPRLQFQLGYLRNIFKLEPENDEDTREHRLWVEVAYDLTIDNYNYGTVDQGMPPMMDMRNEDDIIHSARLYLGYVNQLSENVRYRTGIEGLLNVQDAEDFRLNWDNALAVAIAGNLQAELKFTLIFDNLPPGAETPDPDDDALKTDTTTTLNLVYTLL